MYRSIPFCLSIISYDSTNSTTMQSKNTSSTICILITCTISLSLYLLLSLFSSEKIVSHERIVNRVLQSVERTYRPKPERPSRKNSSGTQLEPKPLDRKPTNGNKSNDDYRIITSHQFVITGDRSAEDLTSCCLNEMIHAVEDTLDRIIENFQNENRKLRSYDQNSHFRSLMYDTSIQYLLFTNLIRKLPSILLEEIPCTLT